MNSNFRTFVAAALVASASTVFADELYVAGPSTLVLQGTPYVSNFNLIGACGGQVSSMTLDGANLYLGDPNGHVYIRDAPSGAVIYAYDVPNDARAFAMSNGNLLSGGTNSTVVRVDKLTGQVISSLPTPVPVSALLVVGSELYIGSSNGVVFRGDAETGGFQFFGTCSGPINSLAIDSTHLMVGSSDGHVYRVNLTTQQVDAFFAVPNNAAAIALHLGDLLVAGSNATIARVDRFTGAVKTTLSTPVGLSALAVHDTGEPGLVYCFGASCPCGNDDPSGGCKNSSGFGARLTGAGSTSVAADDLVIDAFQLPANRAGRFYMAPIMNHLPFGDGFLCAGAAGYPTFRFPVATSGPNGSFELSHVVGYAAAHFPSNGQVLAGETWNFQAWTRDPSGPCGSTFNTTNAYSVTFVP